MKTIHQYLKSRAMQSLKDHQWYLTRPCGAKVTINLIGVDEFIGPTGVEFESLIFTVKVNNLTGKFALSLQNDRLDLVDEI